MNCQEQFQLAILIRSGGYPKFVAQGWNSNWLPLWLQAAGYSTYYTGKLFNAHTVENWNSPHPSGWTSSDFLLDPHTYQYLNATFQRNGDPPVSHEGEYSTDVLAAKAYGLLNEGIKSEKPFFLVAAPVAPHSDVNASTFHDAPGNGEGLDRIVMNAPIPADRHKDLFPDVKVPRTANFNPDKVVLFSSTRRGPDTDEYIAKWSFLGEATGQAHR